MEKITDLQKAHDEAAAKVAELETERTAGFTAIAREGVKPDPLKVAREVKESMLEDLRAAQWDEYLSDLAGWESESKAITAEIRKTLPGLAEYARQLHELKERARIESTRVPGYPKADDLARIQNRIQALESIAGLVDRFVGRAG